MPTVPITGYIDFRYNWDKKFLKLATEIATWSKDTSHKVGAVIVGHDREIISTGYNGMCRGVDDNIPERHERPQKYEWFEHAERNSIYNAARMGARLKGTTLYCASLSAPEIKAMSCTDCTRAIIQSGIVRLVCEPLGEEFKTLAESMGGWRKSCYTSIKMLAECGVELSYIDLLLR